MNSLHILVVDSDAYRRDRLKTRLAKAGHRVTFATNFAEGLGQLLAVDFHAALVDLETMGANEKLLAQLASSARDATMIAMSGDPYGLAEREVRRLGFRGLLSMPLAEDSIPDHVETHVASTQLALLN